MATPDFILQRKKRGSRRKTGKPPGSRSSEKDTFGYPSSENLRKCSISNWSRPRAGNPDATPVREWQKRFPDQILQNTVRSCPKGQCRKPGNACISRQKQERSDPREGNHGFMVKAGSETTLTGSIRERSGFSVCFFGNIRAGPGGKGRETRCANTGKQDRGSSKQYSSE